MEKRRRLVAKIGNIEVHQDEEEKMAKNPPK